MIEGEDVIEYKKEDDFKGIVLEEILNFVKEKIGFELIKLPSKWEPPAGSSQFRQFATPLKCGLLREIAHPNKKLKANKIAVDSSIDSESNQIIKILINGNVSDLKKYLPIQENVINPLYLFLDEEILLYANLKGLKFKQKKIKENKIQKFENEFEKKHPEVKRAIVNSILELYNQ
jgi:tRNA(Ile)-lysidine synthase TilS/MesJ